MSQETIEAAHIIGTSIREGLETAGIRVAEAIRDVFFAEGDEENVPDSITACASALSRLGNADAGTRMGGLEAHGLELQKASERIAGGLQAISEAIIELSDHNTR